MTLLTDRLAEQLKASQNAELELRAEVERLTAALQGLLDEVKCFSVEPPSAALNHAIEIADRALEGK